MSKHYSDKVKQLSKALDDAGKDVVSPSFFENCTSTVLIIAAIIPVIAFLIFYFSGFSFTQDKEGDKDVRSVKKVFIWTAVATLLGWAIIFAYKYFVGS